MTDGQTDRPVGHAMETGDDERRDSPLRALVRFA